MKSNRVGIIGLGNIGMPIAANILKSGFALTVYDVRPSLCAELVADGARAATSSRDVAQASDYVISLVRDIPQTKEVLYGKDGLWDGLAEGKTLVIMSTILPEFIRETARRAAERRVTVIDAAISGADVAAKEGTLTIMAGGPEDAYADVVPLFRAIGRNIFHLGPVGSGMVVKLVNNAIRTVNLYGTREGLKLAVRAGVDPKRLFEVVNVSTGQSWGSDHWERDQREVESYRADPQNSRFANMAKDRDIALSFAREIAVEVPLLQLTKQVALE
jgi:3-hydroxyisobutyrate dehydrogenase-like beta-hydroxyacid dehydrogenase